ncbi:MAG: GIY-YIG nuclease family protein [Bacteroidia bacterium]
MNPDHNFTQLFEKNLCTLSDEEILELNKGFPGGDLNNVIIGLNRHCFGLYLVEESYDIAYDLFYVNNDDGLRGHILNLSMNQEHRDNLTFYFAEYLSNKYSNINSLDTHNTFQSHARSLFEKLGFYTINPEEFKKYDDPKPTILAQTRGIVQVPIYDKADFYGSLFGYKKKNIEVGENYVYIMLNCRSNLFKIGKSKNPSYREKTLQSEEPEVKIVAVWMAPDDEEKKLHNDYKSKRQRGEWFKLSTKDLFDIKDYMNKHILS